MYRHISGWGWYWLLWVIIGFGIPEAYGLIWKASATLSENFWGFEGGVSYHHPFDFSDWPWLHWLIAIMFLVFVIWLTGHLVFGIWR